ncbi:hypothetical protein EIP86_000784 [Pleurotus ostreatoroseus]|nr:hypothetical protein EIP86_000784 [Pleurotus ostreatoroseus]
MPPTRTRATTCAVSPVEVDMEEIDELEPSSEDETGSQLVPKPRIWADVKSYKNIPLLSDEEKVALTSGIRSLVKDVFNVSLPWDKQTPLAQAQFFDIALIQWPFLNQYERAWPAEYCARKRLALDGYGARKANKQRVQSKQTAKDQSQAETVKENHDASPIRPASVALNTMQEAEPVADATVNSHVLSDNANADACRDKGALPSEAVSQTISIAEAPAIPGSSSSRQQSETDEEKVSSDGPIPSTGHSLQSSYSVLEAIFDDDLARLQAAWQWVGQDFQSLPFVSPTGDYYQYDILQLQSSCMAYISASMLGTNGASICRGLDGYLDDKVLVQQLMSAGIYRFEQLEEFAKKSRQQKRDFLVARLNISPFRAETIVSKMTDVVNAH